MALVWVLAFGLVAAYYNVPAVVEGAKKLQEVKASMGLGFAALAGFVAGGILPELAKLLTGTVAKGESVVGEAFFRGLVWVGLAIMVDLFYVLQAYWFGTGTDFPTLVKKTAVDMLVFAPTLFVPYTVGMFVWRREGYKPASYFKVYTPKGWREEVFPTYVPNICFWSVVLFAVYALPTDLQYPMSALATACWSILFTFLQNKKAIPVEF